MNRWGKPTSSGVAVGLAHLLLARTPQAEPSRLKEDEISSALRRYQDATGQVEYELAELCARMEAEGCTEGAIFFAQQDILRDEEMDIEIRSCISEEYMSPTLAVETVYERYAQLLEQSPQPLIRERAADIRDVARRLIRCLTGTRCQDVSHPDRPFILVAYDLFPSDTALLDPKIVKGIVTEKGGATSHSAIIARSYGIPAVSGVEGICTALSEGDLLVLDGNQGLIITQPDPTCLEQYNTMAQAWQRQLEKERQFIKFRPITRDGTAIQLHLNLTSTSQRELSFAEDADGVGLFRTEFLYMDRTQPPTEEEQFQIYRHMLETFSPKPVTIRTLDIGGDKQTPCLPLPKEQNPFLGERALRFCFHYPDLFLTQLRAALRASVFGSLQLMFPMVASLEDFRRAKEFVRQAQNQLQKAGIPFSSNVKLGVMIEIPSLALMADKVAAEADFASIGTNDLTQYLLAADRGEASVEPYYQRYHPAVFRLIRCTVQSFSVAGKPLCVCGELGGDRKGALALIGLGLRSLSLGGSSLASMKKLVCSLDVSRASSLASAVCRCTTAGEAEALLSQGLSEIEQQ